MQPGAQNAYYAVEFAEILLKKYFSIACLWTCLTQKTRKANTFVEGHFKVTKGLIADNAVSIGTPPLKCGRFIRLLITLLLDELKSVLNAIVIQIPSERLCGHKPRATPKPKTQRNASLLRIFNSAKSKVGSSQISASSKHEDVIGIDNPNVEESWARRSQSKHSFFKQKTLQIKPNYRKSSSKCRIKRTKSVIGKPPCQIVSSPNRRYI